MAVYSATKHAVVGLSKTLRAEAAAEGIRVSVFCPGVIRTEILGGGKHGILLESDETRSPPEAELRQVFRKQFEKTRPLDAAVFAKKALAQVAANRAIIVVPGWWKLLWWTERLSPALSLFFAEKIAARVTKDLVRDLETARQIREAA